ncbi:MAG: TetR/AcrR family transcriptional regulator [Paludibacteraceae bacterium]|nr:TetR/AcrR family transcriptional regulator [Paludibacteraceae bacterium]
MNNSRDFILEKAFGQYLEYGYDGVSISVLQESMNLGRATIYYHFTNKENLFNEVVREYVVKVAYIFLEKANKTDITIPQLIQLHTEKIEQIVLLLRMVNPKLRFTNYLALILHAYTHDEEFRKFTNEMETKLHSAWTKAIQNSQNEGILADEVNPQNLATLFCGINEFAHWEASAEDIIPEECTFVKNCLLLFELVKKKEK